MKRVGFAFAAVLLVVGEVFLSGCLEGIEGRDETKSVFILVADGVGARYLDFFETAEPKALDGTELEKASVPVLNSLKEKSLYSILEVRFPETTSSHSVFYIAGDCGREWENTKSCVDNAGITSLCDVARLEGHLCVMASEGGDFREARSEFDVAFFDAGKWDFRVERNSDTPEAVAVEEFFRGKAGEARDREGTLEEYSAFILKADAGFLEFMEARFPEKKFVLFSNAKGVDLCGHQRDAAGYAECIERIDYDLNAVLAFLSPDTVFALTADHGMAFECSECRGAHAGVPFNSAAESLEIPLIVLNTRDGKLESTDSSMLVPVVFSAAGIPDACEKMRYCEAG